MPNYSKKITNTLAHTDFIDKMMSGKFVITPHHRGLVALIYYTGIRITEALQLTPKDFQVTKDSLLIDIQRLKHSHKTPPLRIPLNFAYVNDITETLKLTKQNQRLFPYTRKTGYNISKRVLRYPHYFRLNRITTMFKQGFTIAQVRAWTGLTLASLEKYLAMVEVDTVGKTLLKPVKK